MAPAERSRGALAALLLTLALALPARADQLVYQANPDAFISAGIGALVLGDVLIHNSFAPTECRFCSTNAFDRGVTEALAWENDAAASRLSDAGLVLVPSAAVVYAFARDGWEEGAIDTLVIGQAVGVSFLLTEALKYSVARQRPLAIYLPPTSPKRAKAGAEENISFPSGHSSTTFSAVAALATVESLRGRNPLPIWLVGLPLAGSVAYFRVAGLHHWATDVAAGAAIGTLSGIFVPRLLNGAGSPLAAGTSSLRSGGEVVNTFTLGGAF